MVDGDPEAGEYGGGGEGGARDEVGAVLGDEPGEQRYDASLDLADVSTGGQLVLLDGLRRPGEPVASVDRRDDPGPGERRG